MPELRRSVQQLEFSLAEARAAGLLALAGQTTTLVQRRAQLQTFIARFYEQSRGLALLGDYFCDQSGQEAFVLCFVAELSLYLNLAALLEQTAGHSDYETLLNEAHPELGLRVGMYAELKAAYHRQPWTRPLSVYQVRHRALQQDYVRLGLTRKHAWAFDYIQRRESEMLQRGISTGPSTFAKDAWTQVTRGAHWAWFPAQKQFATALGDTRVVRHSRRLISAAQVRQATRLLRPGDILVERRNWYLSNLGLPGFWPHAALYFGTEAELQALWGDEFLQQLKQRSAKAYQAWTQLDVQAHPAPILEAVSEGVVFTTAEHSLGADFVAALRPRLSDAERRQFLLSAWGYWGRPYDFDFDFRTDQTLVCSELVYKALDASAPHLLAGLPLQSILNRPLLSPNALVQHYAASAGTPAAAFDFVFFLDGVEAEQRAYFRDQRTFELSPLRPKWDVLQP